MYWSPGVTGAREFERVSREGKPDDFLNPNNHFQEFWEKSICNLINLIIAFNRELTAHYGFQFKSWWSMNDCY